MKCPLFATGYIIAKDPDVARICECGKEECAWWDETLGQCLIGSLASFLWSIDTGLKELVLKMPHAEQFTK